MKKAVLFLAVFLMIFSGTVSEAAPRDLGGIAYMNATFKCGCQRTGGGAMIGRNALVTAAHNLVCSTHNKDIKSCSFFFGWDGKTYSYKYSGRYSYTWYADFSKGYSSRDDIAFVIFAEDIGWKTGWYEHGVVDPYDDSLGWESCTIYSFKGKNRVSDRATVRGANSKEIYWTMSSGFSGSQEGGPIFWGDGSYPFVAGVYTSHSGSSGYGRILDSGILNDMINAGANFN